MKNQSSSASNDTARTIHPDVMSECLDLLTGAVDTTAGAITAELQAYGLMATEDPVKASEQMPAWLKFVATLALLPDGSTSAELAHAGIAMHHAQQLKNFTTNPSLALYQQAGGCSTYHLAKLAGTGSLLELTRNTWAEMLEQKCAAVFGWVS